MTKFKRYITTYTVKVDVLTSGETAAAAEKAAFNRLVHQIMPNLNRFDSASTFDGIGRTEEYSGEACVV